jgi:tripartite-type tricarboxylate transporter receptor subunit TctC
MKAWFLASRLRQLALAMTFMVMGTALGFAQSFPQRGIKIIMPFPAGGGADVVGRAVAQQLSESLRQSVIVENVVGAGGTIGTARAAQAAPDGYTLFVGTPSTHGTNVAVYPKLSYDAIKDFVPIGLIATSPLMLIASPTLEVASVGDLIKLAREKPGELAYGSFGTGSINHLAIELFQSMAGIKTNHIPYRGSAPAMTDLIAGRIQYTIDGPAALTFIRANTVKFLAVGSSKRWGFFPDKPTISESGVPGYEALTWFGLFAPAGTPPVIVKLLNGKLNEALATDHVKDSFKTLGVDAAGGTPAVLSTTVDNEIKKWVKIATEKDIKIEP